LSFAPCAVAGFAMGGMVTQALAVKYPQDVRALVLANINHEQTSEGRAALLSRAADARRDGMEKIVDTTMQRWFTDPFIARGGDAAVRERLRSGDARAWCDAFTAMANVDTAAKLKSIEVPTLCLAGEADKSTPPPVVQAMADAIPGSHYTVLPNGPHMMFFEMPEETAKIIGPFFRETLSRKATSP
jgi:3-oxoadipate enol-lactonase